jgi:hypothetical protein
MKESLSAPSPSPPIMRPLETHIYGHNGEGKKCLSLPTGNKILACRPLSVNPLSLKEGKFLEEMACKDLMHFTFLAYFPYFEK